MNNFPTPTDLVQGSIDLVSLPDLVFQVNEMIQDPKVSASDIGEVISKDPSLTARLLKIVNSSFYGYQSRIGSIGRAITILGVQDLQNLVLATLAVDSFSRIPQDLVDMTDFWMKSINCAIVARALAKKASVLHCERLFTSGLLHNVGSLLMYCKLPDPSREVLLAAGGNQSIIPGIEREIIGYNYADVGAEIAKTWQLPGSLEAAIGHHLDPLNGGEHQFDAALVHLGHLFSQFAVDDISAQQAIKEIPDEILQLLGLTEEQIGETLDQIPEAFAEIINLILPSTRVSY